MFSYSALSLGFILGFIFRVYCNSSAITVTTAPEAIRTVRTMARVRAKNFFCFWVMVATLLCLLVREFSPTRGFLHSVERHMKMTRQNQDLRRDLHYD